MAKKICFLLVIMVSVLNLIGCIMMRLAKAKSYLTSGQYEEAIVECEETLKANQGPNPLTINILGVKVNADYFSTLCLGMSYQMIGDFEKSSKYLLRSAQLFPQKSYFSYMGLADLCYQNGRLEDAYNYILKAKDSVNSSNYYRLESKSKYYRVDLWENAVIAASESYELRLNYRELEKEYEFKNYDKVIALAERILNSKYHAHFGLQGNGNNRLRISQ